MRDNPYVGSATVPSSLTVLGQADPAADPNLAFLQRNFVCPTRQLPTIQEGGAALPR